MTEAAVLFRDVLQSEFGLLSWLPLPDGAIHRFWVPGDKLGTRNGWYVFYLEGIPSGAFGSWRAGTSYIWNARSPIDGLEAQEMARRIEQAKRQRELAKASEQSAAAERARSIWHDAQPACYEHSYLIRKGIEPHHLRQSSLSLWVPLYSNGLMINLQQITPDGSKFFLRGGRTKGCYMPLGKPEVGQPLYVCEGFATGATIHAHTGAAVACAMTSGNLLDVGRQLQHRYPTSSLIIAGDNDRKSESEGRGNAGVESATRAASDLGCAMVLPEFPSNAPLELSDFNDLANWRAAQ